MSECLSEETIKCFNKENVKCLDENTVKCLSEETVECISKETVKCLSEETVECLNEEVVECLNKAVECLSEEAVEHSGPKFNPPLYKQRYETVKEILYKIPGIEKVADFGCSDGKFIKFLKNLPFAIEIACVDIDKPSLEIAARVSRPAAWDFIFKRYKDLYIKIFYGSVLEKDARLLGYDAVTCIELVEHLQLQDIQSLISNIFGFICPKIVIFTTPNQDFNVLFPRLTGFRHWDHKFEWTRIQFAQWCENIVAEYPDYSFEIKGIGDPPPESSNVGSCTQLSVFTHKLAEKMPAINSNYSEKPYALVDEHLYPGRHEPNS